MLLENFSMDDKNNLDTVASNLIKFNLEGEGKMIFEGKPKGKGFLYGNPFRQFHYAKFKFYE